MKKLVTGIFVLCFSSNVFAWTVNHSDCESPQAYLAKNGTSIVYALKTLLPVFTSSKSVGLDVQKWGTMNYIGAGLSALELYAQLGVGPREFLNIPLGWVCLELQESQEEEDSE